MKLPNPLHATYSQSNQMLSFNASTGSAKSMTYDENGNMTSIINNCGTTNYAWEARNRLIGINGFTDTCSPITANFKERKRGQADLLGG